MGCHVLLQGIFLTQGLNPSLLSLVHWQVFCFVLFLTTSATGEAPGISTNGFYFQLCFCPKPYVISGRSFTLHDFHANKARRLDQFISKVLSGSKPLWSVHGCSSPAVLLSTQTVFYLYPSCFWSWDHWVWWSLRSSKSSMVCVFQSQHSNQATETRWSFLVHLTSVKELNALPSSNC